MRKRLYLCLLSVILSFSLLACTNQTDTPTTDKSISLPPEQSKNPKASKDSDNTESTKAAKSLIDDSSLRTWRSKLGYSLKYDPALFQVTEFGAIEIINYTGAESDKKSIAVSITESDLSVEDAIEGFKSIKEYENLKCSDATIGVDKIKTKCIEFINNEFEEQQLETCYLIERDKGALFLQFTTYEGAPEIIELHFSNMLDTFKLH